MTYREDRARFDRTHPYQTIMAGGAEFRFLRTGDPYAPALVLLNGGTNTSELWMPYLEAELGHIQIISFDYPMEFPDNQSLMTGLHSFFHVLGLEKPILMGASYGGMAAQLYVQRYPDEVGGLILCASAGLDRETIRQIRRKYFFAPLLVQYLKRCNYEKVKPKLIHSALKQTAAESPEHQAYARDMMETIFDHYPREKDAHITGLMADLMNQTPLIPADLARLKGRILLILPEEDFFTPELQQNLTALMGKPRMCIVRGGHLSTVLRADEYIQEIRLFLKDLGY